MIRKLFQLLWRRKKQEKPVTRLPGNATPFGKVIKTHRIELTEEDRRRLTCGNARIPPYNPSDDPPEFRRVLDFRPPHLRSSAADQLTRRGPESNILPFDRNNKTIEEARVNRL